MSNALFREKWENADLFVEKLNRKKRNLSLKQRAGYDCIVQKVLSRLVRSELFPTLVFFLLPYFALTLVCH